jgi:hypothetical protein
MICALLGTSCVSSYTDALGYRARKAAIARDIDVFQELMLEASETLPSHPRDNPKRTVLTHFLDFGGDPHFYEIIEAWKEKGWVSDNMDCAIHRARYRGLIAFDPLEAELAADNCVGLAREAAPDPERRWVIEACLEEAPFLTRTSTIAVERFIAVAADPSEPYVLRAGVLDGMTHLFLQDPGTLRVNDPKMSREAAIAQSKAQLEEVEARFVSIVRAIQTTAEPGLISGATAFAAAELERVSQWHGKSFFGAFASADSPDDQDLAWGWTRAMKSKKRTARLEHLAFWDRKREPQGDAYWYVCASASGNKREAITVLAESAVADLEALRERECKTSSKAATLTEIFGPYPLESSAKMSVTASTSAQLIVRARKKTKV